MVRLVQLRPRLRVWPGQGSQARAGREQVHLVRLDVQWFGLSLLPDAPP